jgi:DNA-directed DNA polymerase III PolC
VLAAPEEYANRFAVFEEAIRNSEAIAERIAFRPADAPVFPPSPHRDRPAIRELRERAYGGAEARYGELSESVISRLEYELGLIESKGFAEYFLVVEDIVRHSPRTCGRGSGAASLVNFCLGVTNVDPIKYDLMFERFLNPGRTDPPDIDVDFAWDERDEVLDATFARYGRTQVGMVCNHLTFKSRMAIRETARAFGLADEEITRTLKARLPEFREEIGPVAVCDRHRPVPVKAHRMALSEPWPAILAYAKRILGLPRMLSLHCGGMVIVPGEIAAHVPVEPSAKGYPMIQWEKDGTEEMGLVKIDLLGNRSLAVIRDAVAGVARRTGRPESELLPPYPADDPATQALVRDGGTMGCFYIESPAMRLLQKKARRGDFEHMVIHSSIIRPAANHYINEYLARLRGKPWEPLHPRLKGVFDESYGVPVYQEDVCKLAMALAGFDATRADRLRKCLGKRDAAERLAEYKGSFFQGGRDRGVPSRVLDAAWDAIHSMTGYSFCKPHSASYAQVSFEAAYLKAHYPADFLAAVISNGGGYYSAQAYVSEAMRWGLRIHLPCVNRSQDAFVEENGGIRVGLLAIKGLRRESIERIRAERAAHGPFQTLPDLHRRTCLPAEDLHRLAIVGALDTVAPTLNRPQILWMLRQMLPSGTERGAAKQAVLFERTDSPSTRSQAAMPPVPPRLPPFSKRQRMEIEYAYLGFLIGAHPLALYEEYLREVTRNVIPSTHLAAWAGREVTLLGWPVTGKVVSTKHKEAMEFFSFEDAHGIYETVLFPRAYARYARMLQTAQPFLVSGRVEEEFGACSVHLQHLQTLPPPGKQTRVRPDRRRAG